MKSFVEEKNPATGPRSSQTLIDCSLFQGLPFTKSPENSPTTF